MDRAEVAPVARSFVRVKHDEFARTFYRRFLTSDPAVRRLFATTDFERQRELFLHGIYSLIDYARGGATGRLGIRRLGKTHGPRGMNITREMYARWVDSLLFALEQHDPAWSPALRDAWQRVLAIGVEAMLATGEGRGVAAP